MPAPPSRRVVVVGTASLGLAMRVEEFPLCAGGPTRAPAWMCAGVTGVGANVAATMAALGDDVELCTIIGADRVGELVRAELAAAGLLGRGVVTGAASSLALTVVGPDGERVGYSHLAEVDAETYPLEVFEHVARDADLAVITTANFARPLLERARHLGLPVAVDTHLIADVADARLRPWLTVADILFCSHERLPCPPPEWIGAMFSAYPGCLVVAVGCGPDGCVLGTRDGHLLRAAVPDPLPRPVRNSVGAGDVLFASFVHAWLADGQTVTALHHAVVHACWKIGDAFPGRGHLDADRLRSLAARHPVHIEIGRWDTDRHDEPAVA